MEEKKETNPEKMTYEQLEQAAMQLQQRLVIAENRLRSIDLASMRLTWLFKVIENSTIFESEFTTKCVDEVKELMTIDNIEEYQEEV